MIYAARRLFRFSHPRHHFPCIVSPAGGVTTGIRWHTGWISISQNLFLCSIKSFSIKFRRSDRRQYIQHWSIAIIAILPRISKIATSSSILISARIVRTQHIWNTVSGRSISIWETFANFVMIVPIYSNVSRLFSPRIAMNA